jgi:hypothetical protein
VKIGEVFLGFQQRINTAPERVRFVNEFLGLLAVVPEIVGGHQRVEFAEALLRAGYVKETSANGLTCRRRSQFRQQSFRTWTKDRRWLMEKESLKIPNARTSGQSSSSRSA